MLKTFQREYDLLMDKMNKEGFEIKEGTIIDNRILDYRYVVEICYVLKSTDYERGRFRSGKKMKEVRYDQLEGWINSVQNEPVKTVNEMLLYFFQTFEVPTLYDESKLSFTLKEELEDEQRGLQDGLLQLGESYDLEVCYEDSFLGFECIISLMRLSVKRPLEDKELFFKKTFYLKD